MKKTIYGKAAAWLAGALLLAGAPAVASAQNWHHRDYDQRDFTHLSNPQGLNQVTGRVVDLHLMQNPMSNDTDVVAILETHRGDLIKVDLGPEWQARRLSLGIGSDLLVNGHEERVRGGFVLMGEFARSGDQTLNIRQQYPREHFRR